MAGTESEIVPTSGTNTNTSKNITAKRPRVEETDQNRGLASVPNSDQPLDQVLSSLRSSIGDGRVLQILQGIERIVQVPSHVSRLSGLIPPSLSTSYPLFLSFPGLLFVDLECIGMGDDACMTACH